MAMFVIEKIKKKQMVRTFDNRVTIIVDFCFARGNKNIYKTPLDGGGWGGGSKVKVTFMTCHSDSTCPIRTKIGTTKQLDPKNKPVTVILKFRKFAFMN
jgi:hypothetical protein